MSVMVNQWPTLKLFSLVANANFYFNAARPHPKT